MSDVEPDDKTAYWQRVYRTHDERQLSWHQDDPALSLELIGQSADSQSRIIDVGGGSSALAGRLVMLGYERVAVLDISPAAIERARARIGDAAGKVRWIVADVTMVPDLGQFDIWHDRATFHFLTQPRDRRRYVDLAERTIPPGGKLIVATFALDGPAQCSGLGVERYDAAKLAVVLGSGFSLQRQAREIHRTPWGKPQAFTYAVFERLGTDQ